MNIEQEESVIKELLAEEKLESLLENNEVNYEKSQRFIKKLEEHLWNYNLNINLFEDLIRDTKKIDALRVKWINELTELQRFTIWLRDHNMAYTNLNFEMVRQLISSINNIVNQLENRKLVLNQLKVSKYTLIAAFLATFIALIALIIALFSNFT